MYYIEQDDNIILADSDRERLVTTLKFMPEYQDLDIKESDIDIVQFEGKWYFVNDEEYIAKKEQAERERIANLSLTKREVFLALYKDKGVTPEQVRSQITDTEALIEFDYANDYFRGNPLIDKIGIMLGYSMEDLDHLFEYKELPNSADNIEETGDL